MSACKERCGICAAKCQHGPARDHPVRRAVDPPHRRYRVHHCSKFSNHGHTWITVPTQHRQYAQAVPCPWNAISKGSDFHQTQAFERVI